MKWSYPQPGATRVRRVFAWWPVDWNGTSYWLERVEIHERLIRGRLTGRWLWVRENVRPL